MKHIPAFSISLAFAFTCGTADIGDQRADEDVCLLTHRTSRLIPQPEQLSTQLLIEGAVSLSLSFKVGGIAIYLL